MTLAKAVLVELWEHVLDWNELKEERRGGMKGHRQHLFVCFLFFVFFTLNE